LNTRRLLSSAALYGVADIAVMAVSGFLLLPLYTRTLSQREFGMFVAVRANLDILTYLLHFGLPSAVARVYFDHEKHGTHEAYLSSIISFFVIVLAGLGVLLALWGEALWTTLSPTTPTHPYLAFSVAIAAFGFLAAIASLWLRLQNRAVAMVSMQLTTAAVLAVLATVNLAVLGLGLTGLLWAMLASLAFAACVLPWLFRGRFQWRIQRSHITESLHYAVPILVGYIAYFVLNRFSTLVLQRHVPMEEVAVYGLAQQLAMIVTIAGTSFGMALQPAVFGAEPAKAMEALRRSSRILLLLMFCVCAALLLFAQELHAIVAPRSYRGSEHILLILVVANFTNTFTLLSDTALLYHRRPKTSVAVSILSATAATVLGLWLIPLYHVEGAAASLFGALVLRMLCSHWLAYRVTGYAAVGPMAAAMVATGLLAVLAGWFQAQALGATGSVALKVAFAAALLSATYALYKHPRFEP
jgi:O-antigen/teichoic acid export membrane protein